MFTPPAWLHQLRSEKPGWKGGSRRLGTPAHCRCGRSPGGLREATDTVQRPRRDPGAPRRRSSRPRPSRRASTCPHWLWPPTRQTLARRETTPLPLQPMTSLKTPHSPTRRRLAEATASKSRGPASRARRKTPEGRD